MISVYSIEVSLRKIKFLCVLLYLDCVGFVCLVAVAFLGSPEGCLRSKQQLSCFQWKIPLMEIGCGKGEIIPKKVCEV